MRIFCKGQIYRLMAICVAAITAGGCGAPHFPPGNATLDYAYVIANSDRSWRRYDVVKINTKSLEIEQRIPTQYDYDDLTVDQAGDVLLCLSRQEMELLGKRVDILKFGKRRISSLIKTVEYGPSLAFRYRDYYFVLVGGNRSGELDLEKHALNGKLIQLLRLNDNAAMMADAVDLEKGVFYGGGTEFSRFGPNNAAGYFSSIYPIKLDTFLPQNPIPVSDKFGVVTSVFWDDRRLLVFPNAQTIAMDEPSTLNQTILSYTKEKGVTEVNPELPSPIMDIEVDPMLHKLINFNQGRIDFINLKTNTTNTLHTNLSSRFIEYVGNNKLILSHQGTNENLPHNGSKLVIIDTKTEKIVKEIPGNFGPISRNFNF